MTFDEKPAAALVPGDQLVQRNGSRLAPAQMREIAVVERTGEDVLITFRRGGEPLRYPATAIVVVLPKVQREGWWVQG